MHDPSPSARTPLRSVALRLDRHDWWRTHGLFNVFMVVLGLLFLALPAVLWIWGRIAPHQLWLAVVIGVVVLAGEQRVLRSMFAVVSDRPYATFSDWGIVVDGGLFDRWSFPWTDVDAWAPSLEFLRIAYNALRSSASQSASTRSPVPDS